MTVERFVADHAREWDELNALVQRAGARPERLAPAELARLGALYRAAAADLAAARRRFRHDPAVGSLEALVLRARVAVYGRNARQGTLRDFVLGGYWRRVLERPRPLLLAAVLLLVPAALATAWGASSPGDAAALVPASVGAIGEEGADLGEGLGFGPDQSAAFSSEIMTNNIRVAIVAFAGGMTAGTLTIFVMIFNGALIGAVAGIALSAGNGALFASLVAPHGVLELSCIVVAGAAGLRLAGAIVTPGRRRRGRALQEEGRAAAEMVLGTALWLIVAGLVEGFYTPAGNSLAAALAVGFTLGGCYWALAWRLGRRPVTAAPGT